MIKRLISGKASAVWYALSAVVILAGIVLFAIFGFNNTDRIPTYSFEVRYDAYVTMGEGQEDELATICEETFTENGLTEWDKNVYELTTGGVVEYVFTSVRESVLKTVETQVEAKIENAKTAGDISADAETVVNYHDVDAKMESEFIWRGGVAVTVAAALALVYVAIRFGLVSAIVGAINVGHSALLAIALLVVCRIPVTNLVILTVGAVAAILALFYHVLMAMALRATVKSGEASESSAQDVVSGSVASSLKAIAPITGALVACFLLIGLLVGGSVQAFLLPALISVAVSAYSSLLFAPAIHAPLKEKFDRMAAKRKRYDYGKKKHSNEE